MTNIRATLADLMTKTIADRANWTYYEYRPLATPPKPWRKGMKIHGDCSKGVQWLCWWAGAPDPMNNNWDVWGNSTTICATLVHRDSLDAMQVGDPVTFGLNGDEHAAMTMELVKNSAGKVVDLKLWSFGGQGAPNEYLLSQDGRVHQLLKLPVPHEHVPVPPSVLRTRTGYWAWRQWRLGTGEWKGYGKHNRAVRPNVPKRIPLSWWKRLGKELQHHHKGNKPTTPKP